MRAGVVTMAGLMMSACVLAKEISPSHRFACQDALTSGSRPVKIVCFGDSITGVYYHSGGVRAWPEMVEVALKRAAVNANVTVYNAGKSGHTTGAGLKRIQKDVLDIKPDLVVVMFGMNDCAYGDVAPENNTRRLAGIAKNLHTIATMCREVGAEVILCTPNSVYPEAAPRRPPHRLTEVAAVIRDLGKKAEIPIVDMYGEWERARKEDPRQWRLWMSETIHPAMAGHRRLAEMVATQILGKTVSLDSAPLAPALSRFAKKAAAGRALKVICPKDVEAGVRHCIAEKKSNASASFEPFPIGNGTLGDLERQTKSLRAKNPDLILVSFPPSALKIDNEEAFVRSASWVVNWSLPFGKRTWDVVVLSPSITHPNVAISADAELLLRGITEGHDLHWIGRAEGDVRTPEALVGEWLVEHMPQE